MPQRHHKASALLFSVNRTNLELEGETKSKKAANTEVTPCLHVDRIAVQAGECVVYESLVIPFVFAVFDNLSNL